MQTPTVEITGLSSKGQLVIPGRIRKQLGIAAGTKMIVFTDGANVLLKPVETPRIKNFTRLIKKSRDLAKKRGFKQRDIERIIKCVRNEARA